MEDKLYFNGDILTMESDSYTEAVLIRDGFIYRTGKKEELLKELAMDGVCIDLEGKTMMPAFIDAHSHFSGYANSLLQADIKEAANWQEIKEIIENFIKSKQIEKGKWVTVKGLDENNLDEKEVPPMELLDEAAPDNPLVLQHQSGHSGVFNHKALKKLNITSATEDPAGGKIGRKDGKLTGLLEENAYVDNVKNVPIPTFEELKAAFLTAQDNYASFGITTMQEGMVVNELVPLLQYLQNEKLLKLDLVGYLNIKEHLSLEKDFEYCLKKYYHHFKVGGYKFFLDGSPQMKTAWMLKPYITSHSGDCGYPIYTDGEVEQYFETAIENKYQVLVHCNGDAACDQFLAMYQKALEKTKKNYEIRPVMVHAQLMKKNQVADAKQLKVIPSFFVAHVYYWGDVHIKNFGLERASQISPARTAKDMNLPFTFHQDSPVIEPNMLETVSIAVNRKTKAGVILGEKEEISVLDALKAVTIHAAYQYFEENEKGSIKQGKRADLIILDKNPLKVKEEEIKEIKVLETLKDGIRIFQRNYSMK